VLCLLLLAWAAAPGRARGQEPASGQRDLAAASELAGRTVESVQIIGNTQVSSSVIRELVRTHEGEKFDPATVVEDYQRIYDRMKMFANVEARVQPTPKGVIVIFVLTEQKQIHQIRYAGNVALKQEDLEKVVDLKHGQAIESFRINLARQAIVKLYRDKNFPFAHVEVSPEDLVKTGDVVFRIVEGPQVQIKKVDFIGNQSFTVWRLKDQIKTGYYIVIFRAGTFDPEQVDDDVVALERFYQNKGFFDARVGRKLTLSSDMKEMQVTYVIDEGPRYVINRVEFRGLRAVSEGALRKQMEMLEDKPYDADGIDRDRRAIVKVYSQVGGYIFEEQPGLPSNPEYLQINPKREFLAEPGKLNLVYEISEGKQFRLGRVLVKGNTRTQDNVILREMRMRPGQQYNSAEVEDATDRLRGTPYFSSVSVTTIGNDPGVRDLLVEVTEAHTAQISAGVGINSDGGLGGQLSYEQKNFDITNWPATGGEFFSDRAFTGAGQDFLASYSPGTLGTDATLGFTEPYLFDQPYSVGITGYLRDRIRDLYYDNRLGGRLTLGQQFNYVYSGDVFLRGEDVYINNLTDPPSRAEELVEGQGHHTLTSAGLQLRRDTTNHGPITYRGTLTEIGVEKGDALGGTVDFSRLTLSFNDYVTLDEDLLERKTVLNTRLDVGWDPRRAPFYERFYGGGIGSIRGFQFREVSPRAGPNDDAVGGDFTVTGGAELSFPLAEDFLRGVLFVDAGDVESNPHFGVIRSSGGFGVRLVLPFFGQMPLALDFGFPITQNRQDRTQVLSFSFGIYR